MKTSVKSPLGERVTLCQEGSALEISPALPARNLSSVPRTVKTAPPVGSWQCAHQCFLLASSLVVAVYIKGSWWSTEDVLRTSDPAREGLVKVRRCPFKLQNGF